MTVLRQAINKPYHTHTTLNNIFPYIHDFFTSGRKGSRADEEEPDLGISYEVLPAGAGEMPEVGTL